MKVAVIVNPSAGTGSAQRAAKQLALALEARGVEHELFATERAGHAPELVRAARDSGAEVVAAVGGDGTLNEVCQAYVDPSGGPVPGPAVCLVPAGTGGDFARGSGLPTSPSEIAERLLAGERRRVDLGVLSFDGEAPKRHHAFVNVASLGISGEVDERVERGPKWLGGKAAFLLGTVGAALAYRNAPIDVEVDGERLYRGPAVLIAIANGQYFGGGMQIAPNADPTDGLFDVVCVGNLSRASFLTLFPRVYRGRHLDSPQVLVRRGRQVTVKPTRPGRPLLVDADGQTPGLAPISTRLLPGALEMIA